MSKETIKKIFMDYINTPAIFVMSESCVKKLNK